MNHPRISHIPSSALLFCLFLAGALAVVSCSPERLRPSPSAQPTWSAITPSPWVTPEPTPGLVISGVVLDEQGNGVEGVQIYRGYSAYPAELIATTDATGRFMSEYYYIPGDEMVSVRAEKSGFKFEPADCSFRHYYGYEQRICNFSALQP